MLLITGGSAYNASKFIENCEYTALVPKYKNNLATDNRNIIFFKNLSDLYKSEDFKNVEYFINFSSSYNYDRSYKALLSSSIFYALKILLKLNRKKLKLFINIGSYLQDAKVLHRNRKKYVNVKKFSDFLFSIYVSKKRYLNLKLGDTYGPNDPRNKLNSILNEHLSDRTLNVYGSKHNILYPVSITEISDCISYIIENSVLFENPNLINATVYGKGVTLLEYIDSFKSNLNLDYEVDFKEQEVHIEVLDQFASDFNFLIKNI